MRSVTKKDNALGQQSSGPPQFREEFFVEGQLEIRGSRAATGSHAGSDDALDQLDVAQAPAHDELVEFGETLADVDPVAMMPLIFI